MNKFYPIGLLHPYVRFLNASCTAAVDFLQCNYTLYSGLNTGAITPYIKTMTGLQTFSTYINGHKITIRQQFNPGDVYCISLIKNNGTYKLHCVGEPHLESLPDYNHLRICNLSEQYDKCHIYANDECIASYARFCESGHYIAMIPSEYTFSIRKSTSQSIPPDVSISCTAQKGKYNTMYITEPKPGCKEPGLIFTTDAASIYGFYL